MLIKKPSLRQAPNPTAYFNRHNVYSLNVQAVSDARGRVTWASIRTPGSVHDNLAYSISSLCNIVSALGGIFHLVGDSAYVNDNTMLGPFPQNQATAGTKEDVFNYYQSLTRQPVERCFGMIQRRWGVLWRRLEVNLDRVPLVLFTIFYLHNLCVEANVPDVPVGRMAKGAFDYTSNTPPPGVRYRNSELRDSVVARLAEGGFCRPPL